MDANLPGTFLLNSPSLGPFPEAKTPVCQYSVQSSFYKLGPPGLGAQLAAGTPHGISDILSRPAATPNSSLLPGYPHTGGFNGLSSPGVYYGPQVGALPKAGGEYLPRGRSCWAEAAPDWRGGRQCSGRKYRGARAVGWWVDATGGGCPAEPRPIGTGAGTWGSCPGCVFSTTLPKAWLVTRRAAPGGWEWPWRQSCQTSTCRRGFGSRAGAAPMAD